jgi:hypothetical protein
MSGVEVAARLEQRTVQKQGLETIVVEEVAQGAVEEDEEGIMVGEINKTRKKTQATVVWTSCDTLPILHLADWTWNHSN